MLISGTSSHALKKPKWGKPTKTKTKNKREKNVMFEISLSKSVREKMFCYE